MGIEILDRQILHAAEHGFAELVQEALRDNGIKLVVSRDGRKGQQIEAGQQDDPRDDLAGGGGPAIFHIEPFFYGGDDLLGHNGRQGGNDRGEQDTQR